MLSKHDFLYQFVYGNPSSEVSLNVAASKVDLLRDFSNQPDFLNIIVMH